MDPGDAEHLGAGRLAGEYDRERRRDHHTYPGEWSDDVRYLPTVHAAMKKRITDLGHLEWMRGACNEMCAHAAGPVEARKLFMRIRGAPGLNGTQLSVLREITALREQIAYEHDVPSRSVLKDEVLLDMATRMPASLKALAALKDIPQNAVENDGEAFLDAIARGDVPRTGAGPAPEALDRQLAQTLVDLWSKGGHPTAASNAQ